MESKENNYELARNQGTEADDYEICCMHGLLCHVGLKTYNDTKARNKQESENSSEEGEKEPKKPSKSRRPNESSSNAEPNTSGNSAVFQPQFSGETKERDKNKVNSKKVVPPPNTVGDVRSFSMDDTLKDMRSLDSDKTKKTVKGKDKKEQPPRIPVVLTMFRKPFNVKKSISLKSSDARKLLTRALGDSAGTDAFAEYKKALISQTTITLFSDATAVIYSIQKTPLFYEYEDEKLLYPSVFFLWRHPHFLPAVFIHEQVFRYLENGADLMAPGIVSSMILSEFVPGQIVAVWIFHNGEEARGPVAVGKALLSSAEIQTGRALGKAVAVVHWHKDLLWSFGEKGDPPTKTVEDLVKEFTAMNIEEKEEEEPQPRAETESKEEGGNTDLSFGMGDNQFFHKIRILCDLEILFQLYKHRTTLESSIAVDDKPKVSEKNEDEDGEAEEQTAESEAPEQLLRRCFIAALKFRVGKSITLPLDVGQFYSQFLLPTVPNGRRLDIKKTPYKKFSVFLEHINKHEGGPILKIKKGKKGDDAIDEISWSHPLIRSFEPTDEKLKDEEQPTGKKQAVSITQYVSNLTSDKKVKLDPLLANVTKSYETEMDWNKLIQSIQSKMTPAFVIRTPDGKEIVRKIKMPHIEFKVETRSGNKKVTLINNLTPFGIDIKTICNQIKIGVSTSATVNNEAVNCEGPQVSVQGNQIHFIGDLLKNEYQLDPKYMVGLNLAVKKKK
ncbi:hypothetical protein WR25_03849 [Diploscapter pachys]|uniref:SUI1 domain-containing protein n=1 Tax=Diploscapter pachys TaxID=2018661 RepID=A0A2A2JMN4_9BILA|nr:hypothetical protein WR25_03849 [Diploscapter pachys]